MCASCIVVICSCRPRVFVFAFVRAITIVHVPACCAFASIPCPFRVCLTDFRGILCARCRSLQSYVQEREKQALIVEKYGGDGYAFLLLVSR